MLLTGLPLPAKPSICTPNMSDNFPISVQSVAWTGKICVCVCVCAWGMCCTKHVLTLQLIYCGMVSFHKEM